jgi:hypothetical protein
METRPSEKCNEKSGHHYKEPSKFLNKKLVPWRVLGGAFTLAGDHDLVPRRDPPAEPTSFPVLAVPAQQPKVLRLRGLALVRGRDTTRLARLVVANSIANPAWEDLQTIVRPFVLDGAKGVGGEKLPDFFTELFSRFPAKFARKLGEANLLNLLGNVEVRVVETAVGPDDIFQGA